MLTKKLKIMREKLVLLEIINRKFSNKRICNRNSSKCRYKLRLAFNLLLIRRERKILLKRLLRKKQSIRKYLISNRNYRLIWIYRKYSKRVLSNNLRLKSSN